jgi:hypothetical protein
MSAGLIVAIAIWDGLLVAGLAVVIRWRRQLPAWVTGLDGWRPPQPDADDPWTAFLAEHPELRELETTIAATRSPVAGDRRA